MPAWLSEASFRNDDHFGIIILSFPSEFALALRLQNSVLEMLDKVMVSRGEYLCRVRHVISVKSNDNLAL